MKWTITLGEAVIIVGIIVAAVTLNMRVADLAEAMKLRPTWTELEAKTGVSVKNWDEASDMLRKYRMDTYREYLKRRDGR